MARQPSCRGPRRLIQFPAGGLSERAAGRILCSGERWEEEESEMEINCLGCGFKVDLTDTYDDLRRPDQVLRLWRDHGDRDPGGRDPGSQSRDGGAAPSAEVFVVRSPD
jgi:hypothetical protein